MEHEQKKRLKRTVLITVLFALLSLFILWIFAKWHIGIPCIFNKLTGLKCPGCGMTRGLVSLLRLDFAVALRYNAFIVPICAYLAAVYFNCAKDFIKTGKFRVAVPCEAVSIVFLTALIIWWVLRNIIGA